MTDWVALVACLEKAAGEKIAEREQIIVRVSSLTAACIQVSPKPKSQRLSVALYGLAVLYADFTHKVPGYSRSENSTHFERFVWLALRPADFRLTAGAVKVGIQKLALNRNAAFAHDVRGLIRKWPNYAREHHNDLN